MKKMISVLTAFSLLACVPTAAVFAADTSAASASETAADLNSTAVSKMKNMNVIIKLTAGALSDSKEFTKVSDTRFKTVESVKAFISETCTGSLKDTLLQYCDSSLTVKEDGLYAKTMPNFYYTFLMDNGVVITDSSASSFNAITQKNDEMNGYGKAVFALEDGKWKISGYDFGFFTANKKTEDLANAAYVRIFHLQTILDLLAYGAPADSKDKITVDGKTYGKVKDDLQVWKIYSMKEYITEHCTGALRDDLIKQVEDRYVEKDDVLYAVIGARGALDFNLDGSVTVSNVSANGFTATTVEKSDKDGYGRVVLAADGDKWLVKSYEFVDSNDAPAYTLGDVDNDGKINAVDASTVLTYYANVSTNKDGGFTEDQKMSANVNSDNAINAVDASCILSYYAYVSTAKDEIVSIEEFLKK